ncbi:ATP synthase subunit I [Marinicella sp. W31]|uniref:ATP synthase subunit I n=1 Tax=Marinicella sp. W31 TaxID=3023713 RepID=UPI00375795D2
MFKIPLLQLLIGMACALVFLIVSSQQNAIAAMAGAVVSTAGSLMFALIVFVIPARDARAVVGRMFKGELFKMMVVAILFYWCITWFKFPLMPLIVGFSVTFVAFWVALLKAFK